MNNKSNDIRIVKVSELPESTSFEGLHTLGVDASNKSVKVSLQEVGEATNAANNAADTANTAADAANEATNAANEATDNANNATENANNATNAANEATDNANDAAENANNAAAALSFYLVPDEFITNPISGLNFTQAKEFIDAFEDGKNLINPMALFGAVITTTNTSTSVVYSYVIATIIGVEAFVKKIDINMTSGGAINNELQDMEIVRIDSTIDNKNQTLRDVMININGTTGKMSLERYLWGDDTPISATIPNATDERDGVLSKEDWVTFNNKQDKLTAGANITIVEDAEAGTTTISAVGGGGGVDVVQDLGDDPLVVMSQQAVTNSIYNDPENRLRVQIGNNAEATTDNGIAIGTSTSATSGSGTAIGNSSTVTATRGIALGVGAACSGDNGVAISTESQATGSGSVAIGVRSSSITDSVSIGINATASGASSMSIGGGTVASGNSGVALGKASRCLGVGSIALGALSEVMEDESEVASFGKADFQRRLINVADGINATDAATVGQIFGNAVTLSFKSATTALTNSLAQVGETLIAPNDFIGKPVIIIATYSISSPNLTSLVGVTGAGLSASVQARLQPIESGIRWNNTALRNGKEQMFQIVRYYYSCPSDISLFMSKGSSMTGIDIYFQSNPGNLSGLTVVRV